MRVFRSLTTPSKEGPIKLTDFNGHLSNVKRTAATWAGGYLLVAVIWVLGTDTIVAWTTRDPSTSSALQSVKGILWIVLTALFVFLALTIALRRVARVERRWHHFMHAMDDVCWVVEPTHHQIIYLNPAAARVYGRPVEDLLADSGLWLQVVHPEDRDAVAASAVQIAAGGSRDIQYRICRPDGSVRWLRDRAAMIRGFDGTPIGLGGIAEDITDELLAREAVQEQRARLEGIVETAMDAIITIDAAQNVRLFNRAASEVFQIAAQDAIGQSMDRFVPASQQMAHRRGVDAFRQHGETRRRMGMLHTLVGVRSNGEEFPVEASISKSGEGDALLMTVVLRDVTETQRSEAARRAQMAAEMASQAKSDFLSRMSHELRTPLNAVIGFSHLLDTDTDAEPLNARQKQRVGHIEAAGWHLLALINDVLDVSRIESGQLRVEARAVVLAESIDEAVAMCAEQARQRRVTVNIVDHDLLGVCVHGDAIRLRQVLINLLTNAIKYNRNGGSVDIELKTTEGLAIIEVVDSGVGMTAEQLAHLYEPFNRLGRERAGIEGTGIGLVLTKQLVELMQGRLEIASEVGRGTVARVVMPMSDDAPLVPVPATFGDAVDPSAPAAVEPSGVVLYIEDNPVNVLVVEQLLSRWERVRFIQAEDGASGVDLALKLQPDLVLLDMRLPDMHGTDVLGRLRAEPRTAALPVVALSAGAMAEDAAAATAAGALEYWTKPLDYVRFIADMTRLLTRSTD